MVAPIEQKGLGGAKGKGVEERACTRSHLQPHLLAVLSPSHLNPLPLSCVLNALPPQQLSVWSSCHHSKVEGVEGVDLENLEVLRVPDWNKSPNAERYACPG